MRTFALPRAAACCALLVFANTRPIAAHTPDAAPIVPPRLIERVTVEYPEEAQREGLTGNVLIRLVIDAEGRVSSASVVQGAGHGFDEAALAAARKLRFEPATRDGTPIAVQIDYDVRFEPTPVPAISETARPVPAIGDTARPASAPEPSFETTIEGQRPFTAASSSTVRARDFLLRPRFTPEDILRVVPGLVLAQHQGGGKADQLFLRGFDADHGTDVSLNLDGVPVNMPSHAHGQGYADLHFLIPEAIDRIDIAKGPYFVEYGDFDTAGAVNLVTRDAFDRSQLTAQVGAFPTLTGKRDDGTARGFAGYRFLGIGSAAAGDLRSWFAGELAGTGGPFLNSERMQRFNLFAKVSWPLAREASLSLLALAYSSSWTGSGQIPARLVDAGLLDRYGAIDPTEGGDTQRLQGIASLRVRPDPSSSLTAVASAIRYGLTLFNNFTFQADNPQSGDEIEQDDRRTILFASLRYDRTDHLPVGLLATTFGAQLRHDDVDASLWKAQKRVRLPACLGIANPCVSTNDRQTDAAMYVQEDLRPARWLRLIAGVRADLFEWDVRSLKPSQGIDAQHPDPAPPAVQASVVSPKASAVLSPLDQLDLYFNYGRGFHSNDARSAIESGGAGALPRAIGYEVGARTRLFDGRLELAAAVWRLDLASELVWSGDNGGTEPSGPTRREGVDLEARYVILPWLFADADVSLARSRYKVDAGNGNAVALAPARIVTGGLTARHPSGVQLALRVRHIGARPASQLTASDPLDAADPAGPRVPPCTPALDARTPEGQRCYLVADGYTVLDAALAYVSPRFEVAFVAENLANATYREAQFGNASQVVDRVPDLRPAFVPESHPIQDVHFTPGNPIALQLRTTLKF